MSSLPITTTNMDMSKEAHSDIGRSNKKKKRSQREYWLEDIRGSIMVVATVIATLTFQIAINPPGGVWQSDSDRAQGCGPDDDLCRAGTSVLAFGSANLKTRYEWFILLCTLSFSSAMAVILFLMSGFPLDPYPHPHKFVTGTLVSTWVFIMIMWVSVMCLAATYIFSIQMITDPFAKDAMIARITKYYAEFWIAFVTFTCVGFSIYYICRSIKNIRKPK